MRRKLTAIAASCAVVLVAGVSLATPAHAADVTATYTGSSLTMSPTSITRNVGQTFSVTFVTSGGPNLVVNGNFGGGQVSQGGTACSPTGCIVTSGATVVFTVTAVGTMSMSAGFMSTLIISAGSSPDPSGATSSPVIETLSLSVAASGATCTGGDPTGYAGTWLTLPGADKCSQSGPTAKPGAKLLGWATSASFPIDRAQAQIDKHWGVIDEVINGQRMIFIPGGMATFVSGSNNLFPIWSA